MNLRPYQKQLIIETAQKLRKSNKVIMCAPTGSGKTVIFSTIIKRHLEKDIFNRVLVLTHRTELFTQTIASVAGRGVSVTQLRAGQKIYRDHKECRCLVAMVETMKRRKLEQFGKFSLIIIDEAHRADFNKIIDNYPDTDIIGATATPISASKKRPLKNYYNDIAISVGIQDLITQGYLATPVHYKATFDDSKLRKRGGEYTNSTQFETLGNKIAYDNLIDLWRSHAGNMKTIVFNINKEHTRQVHEQFKRSGIKSAELLSGDPKRDEKMKAFKSGQVQVLNNCEIATTGFDVPDIECVIVNRFTASLPLWLQMVGRGSRIAPGKTHFTILDFGGNIDRHGMWHTPYDWEKIFRNPKKADENPAPHKECPKCGWILYASLTHCPDCDYKFPTPEEQETQRVRGYLEKVGQQDIEGSYIDDLDIHQLYHLEKSGRYKPSYIARVARTRGKSELATYAKLKGYKAGWIAYQSKMETGYTNYRVKV